MNLQFSDLFVGQNVSREWSPLITQQLRLRHLRRITAYNIVTSNEGEFYYTLHQALMSAPFYTSEKITSPNPRWKEIELQTLPHSAIKACVLRIWQTTDEEMDKILITWGVNFSGLVYLGSKLSDVQPSLFKDKTVILHLHGGFFTSASTLCPNLQGHVPFVNHLNISSTEDDRKVYRLASLAVPARDVKHSYNVEKLRELQSLQLTLKNKYLELDALQIKINDMGGADEDNSTSSDSTSPSTSPNSGVRYAPQLLTMNSLNKMLQEKPTKTQKKEILRLSKELQAANFKIKILTQEKNKQLVNIRQLKEKHSTVCDKNEDTESTLMEQYRQLSRDLEKARERKKEQLQNRQILLEYNSQLYHRRKQLLNQLLELYPIECDGDQRYTINGVHLPSSELLNDSSQNDVAVALGFVAHIVVMCSNFLQVPLRYPIIHMGSRSLIIDHISPTNGEMRQQYPLYLRGKDRFQFNYAVCLLNKNIAQLRWICGLHTQNLKATLPNLLTFLLQRSDHRSHRTKPTESEYEPGASKQVADSRHGHDVPDLGNKDGSVYSSTSSIPFSCVGSTSNIADPTLESLRHECQAERTLLPRFKPSERPRRSPKVVPQETSLSQVLAIPEAFLNQQISPNSFKSYMTACNKLGSSQLRKDGSNNEHTEVMVIETNRILSCDINDGSYARSNIVGPIEEGADLTDPSVCHQLQVDSARPIPSTLPTKIHDYSSPRSKRLSRSVDSYDEEKLNHYGSATGSDSVLTGSKEYITGGLINNANKDSAKHVQEWLNNKPSGNIIPDDRNKDIEKNTNYPLTVRTDALLNATSFHLVKPK